MRQLSVLGAVALLMAVTAVGAADAPLPTPPRAFSAGFVQTRSLPGFSQPLVSRGRVSFSRDAGVSWEVTTPYHYLFKMGAAGMQETLPDGTQRKLDPEHAPWLAVMEHIFTSALAGDTSDLANYFAVRVTPTADGRQIELTPKPGPMAKAIQHISVDESGTPRSLRIDEVAGGRIEIRFLDARSIPEKP